MFKVVEIALAAHAGPDHSCTVGKGIGDTVDASEGEAGVAGEVFHKDKAHLIIKDGSRIGFPLFLQSRISWLLRSARLIQQPRYPTTLTAKELLNNWLTVA